MRIKIIVIIVLCYCTVPTIAMDFNSSISSAQAVFNHPDFMTIFTSILINNESLNDSCENIRSLAVVNKNCNAWYNNNKISIVQQCQQRYKISTKDVTVAFKFHEYTKKIDNVSAIIDDQKKSFTKKDLSDKFLMNVRDDLSRTLLWVFVEKIHWNIVNEKIVYNTLNLSLSKLKSLLTSQMIVTSSLIRKQIRYLISSRLYAPLPQYYLPFIQTFIDTCHQVDYRLYITQYTFLMNACRNADQCVCYLLLRKGANPYNVSFSLEIPKFSYSSLDLPDNDLIKRLSTPENLCASKQNASDELKAYCLYDSFDLCPGDTPQQKKDWLQRIIDFVAKEKEKEKNII